MQKFAENLQIVVLDSPYDTWGNPLVPDFFRDMVGVKLRGYGCEYPYGVLPVDGADLISTHLLLCRKDPANDRPRPIMGIRWTSHVKCREHYVNFPGLSLLEQAGASEHAEALKEVIRSADSRGAELYYSGSLTIEPEERKNKAQSAFFREILTMMYVNYQGQNSKIESMAGGTMRFKIDEYMRWLGHVPLQKAGRELGPIRVHHLAGEPVHVMHLPDLSFAARESAKKWNHLWERRLWIRNENQAISEESMKRAG